MLHNTATTIEHRWISHFKECAQAIWLYVLYKIHTCIVLELKDNITYYVCVCGIRSCIWLSTSARIYAYMCLSVNSCMLHMHLLCPMSYFLAAALCFFFLRCSALHYLHQCNSYIKVLNEKRQRGMQFINYNHFERGSRAETLTQRAVVSSGEGNRETHSYIYVLVGKKNKCETWENKL